MRRLACFSCTASINRAGGKDVRTRRDSKDAANLSRKLGERAQILQMKLASYMAMATAFWQMVTNLSPIYDIQWPGSFAIFMRQLGGIISRDIFTLLPIDCMGRTNRHSALLLLEDLYVAGTATVISFRLGGLKEGQASLPNFEIGLVEFIPKNSER